MSKSDYVKLVLLRGIIFSARAGMGQNSTPAPPNTPCKPSNGSIVGVITGGVAAQKLCRFGICLPPKAVKTGEKTCPPPPAAESKPAPPPATKEVCPVGMQLGADEKGKHWCSDGVHTSEPAKFTPLGPSTPAPVNSSQAPVAR